MGLRLQLQQVCEPAVSPPPGQFYLQDGGSVCHNVEKNVPIFIAVMSWNFTHEIIKLNECEEIWKWAWCISRCRGIQLFNCKDQKNTHKKYASITMPVLTSISILLYYRFARYTPPPTNSRAFVHRTSPVSKRRSTLYHESTLHFLLDVYFPAFKMLPSLDAAHNVHLVHANHTADLFKLRILRLQHQKRNTTVDNSAAFRS
jgi:hypothetical protein